MAEGTLEVVNSIVWGNVTQSAQSAVGNNFVNQDPLFSSATVYSLRAESPAVGKGNNSAWQALGITPAVDIAGAQHATPMNIGAFENSTPATVTFGALTNAHFMVYAGNRLIASGEEFPVGTEIIVTVLADQGYRVMEIRAGSHVIANGASYHLPGNTTLTADIVPGRLGLFPTLPDGGTFEVYNSIIYDNIDAYGNYALDGSNLAGNPDFTSATHFTLLPKSSALGIAEAGHIPAGITLDIAGSEFGASVNAGAFQNAEFTVTANITGSGTVKIFHTARNEVEEAIKTEITADAPGTLYGPGTITIEAYPATGYVLKVLKANGTWLNPGDENRDPNTGTIRTTGSFTLSVNSTIEVEFIAATTADQKAAVSLEDPADVFANNIVYGNLGFPSNRNEDTANLTEDPSFISVTRFALQPSSAAINAGDDEAITGYTTYLSLYGQPRVLGDAVDMGAYETGEIAYTVTYSREIISGDVVVARLELFDTEGNLIPTGSMLLPGTEIEVKVTVLNADYQQLGRIRLTYNGENEYIDGTSFELEANTSVSVTIQENPRRSITNPPAERYT